MIIDDVDSKPPYLSGICETGRCLEKECFKAYHSLCGESLHKGENMEPFFV